MKGQFSFKFGTSASNRLSEVELPTAMSSNTSIATHQPSTSSTSLAPITTKNYSRSSKSKSSHSHSANTSNKATTSGKKIDFKDTKSLKSVKSEGSNVSYFGAFTNTTSDEVIKANKKGSKSSGSGLCSMNKRYNESQPVYRGGQSRPRSRFSLRNLLYSNPLRSNPFLTGGGVVGGSSRGAGGSSSGSGGSRAAAARHTVTAGDTGSEGSWMDRDSQGTSSSAHHHNQDQTSHGSDTGLRECVLCLAEYTSDQFPLLLNCNHLSCIVCLQQYVRIEVQEGRANLKCPQCSQLIHPNDIEFLIGEDTSLYGLYQFLMVRRVLAADPDTRWCPAPNCTFAVIAAGCASCPKIDCEREGCNFSFCYHCKAEWHPNITCDQARAKRHPVRSGSEDSGVNGGGLEVKVCPRCSVLIVKMDDGSCNHMTCAVCGSEFCWLCMKEISDLHYLSPSGCTFWGKKPWSRKKKLLWQLGTIVGAPVGIALIAGISIPAMVIGIPVWVGRRIKSRHTFSSKPRRVTAIAAGVVSSVFVSPILAGLVVCVGVPCLLAYVYGVVPFSLCRSGGCGLSTTTQGVRIDVDEDNSGGYRKTPQQTDHVNRQVANPSIGELSLGASLSMGSGSHLDRLAECDRESASNTAIAGYSLTGSVASSYLGQHRLEVGADVHPRKKFSFSSERLSETVSLSEKSATVSLADNDGGASTRALAGSIIQYRMENASVNSYKTGQATPGSSISAGHDVEGVSYRPDADMCLYPSGDEISVRSVPGMRSLSPVHGEDVSAALRRSRGRRILEKQQSETSGNDDLGSGGGGSQGEIASDRVRFDTHVSYLDTSIPGPSSYLDTSSCSLLPGGSSAPPPLAAAAVTVVSALAAGSENISSERSRLVIKKGDLDPETLREETAEELAMVVSPITPRARSVSPLSGDSPACSLPQILEQPVIQIDESLKLCVTETCPSVHLDLTITETSTSTAADAQDSNHQEDQSNISLVLVDGQSSTQHTQSTDSSSSSIQLESTAPVHESTLINDDDDSPRSITNLLGESSGGDETTVYNSCLSNQDAELGESTVFTTAHNSISINVSGSNNN